MPGALVIIQRGTLMNVNACWRICFSFRKGDAHDVETVDYYKG